MTVKLLPSMLSCPRVGRRAGGVRVAQRVRPSAAPCRGGCAAQRTWSSPAAVSAAAEACVVAAAACRQPNLQVVSVVMCVGTTAGAVPELIVVDRWPGDSPADLTELASCLGSAAARTFKLLNWNTIQVAAALPRPGQAWSRRRPYLRREGRWIESSAL